MLEFFSKSRRKVAEPPKYPYYPTPAPAPAPKPHLLGNGLTTLFGEAARKDAIIKDLVKRIELQYKEGDVVLPSSKSAREELGESLTVQKIVRSYAQYGKNEEWPKNDNPMIVQIYSQKTDTVFFCTTNYVMPFNPDGSVPKARS